MRSRYYSTLEKNHYESTPTVAGGVIDLVFTKTWKLLENHFLKPILRSATIYLNKLNLSLIVSSYLQT